MIDSPTASFVVRLILVLREDALLTAAVCHGTFGRTYSIDNIFVVDKVSDIGHAGVWGIGHLMKGKQSSVHMYAVLRRLGAQCPWI